MRISLLTISILLAGHSVATADDPPKLRFPPLNQAKTWQRLPQKNPPLPVWARILSRSLPKTTAAMLQLDTIHRAHNPLDSVLRGKLRWAAAKANGCNYALQYAEADLRRAGVSRDAIKKLTGDHKDLPEKERLAMAFARKMSLKASTVTDEEVAELLKHFGPKTLTAMVHTLAYANFQDRLLLALGVEVEKGGPFPPVEVEFDPQQIVKIKQPKRPSWSSISGDNNSNIRSRPEWAARSFAELQKSLAGQKTRKSRIPLPPSTKSKRPSVSWTVVSMEYAPELTQAWFTCLGIFNRESSLDPIFSNSLFWVVTRSNECFY